MTARGVRGSLASGSRPASGESAPGEPTAGEAARRRSEVVRVDREGDWLHAVFPGPRRTLGWTIVGGGFACLGRVAWLQVRDADLRPPVDPVAYARERAAAAGLGGAAIFLTGCDLDGYAVEQRRVGDLVAVCVATVGLGNALRAGDPAAPAPAVGTINLLCHVSTPLTDEAMIEALALATEARTAEVLGAGIASTVSGRPATGTGTDCALVAAPPGAPAAAWAGKHTALGQVIGEAVGAAVGRGIAGWKAARAGRGGCG